MSNIQIEMLTKKLEVLKTEFGVMQKEVSEVIGEMHQGLTAMMNSLRIMAQTYNARLEELENTTVKVTGMDPVHVERKEIESDSTRMDGHQDVVTSEGT